MLKTIRQCDLCNQVIAIGTHRGRGEFLMKTEDRDLCETCKANVCYGGPVPGHRKWHSGPSRFRRGHRR